MNTTNKIAFFIGIISVILGIYKALIGELFNDYFFTIFIGISLLGVSLLNNKKRKELKN